VGASRHVSAEDTATGWPPVARVGEVLGSYRLLELIGRGGMGCVYRAEHVKLGREVALKLLNEEFVDRRDAVARFMQEARAVGLVRHPNIVDVIDYLELEKDACIVMEYVSGVRLDELMKTAGALPAPRALDLLGQICDGLEAAHTAGIIHRDLKPENIVVVTAPDGSDVVKILDFGVAKLVDRVESLHTGAGQVMGTPPYMSPEQLGGTSVDGRSDIYALGAIMYELFTGRLPFEGRSFDEYAFKHMVVAPERPCTGKRELDPRIDAVIMRCLEKAPEARFQSARELRGEVVAIRDSLFLAAIMPPPVVDEEEELIRPPRRWAGFGAIGAALLAIVVAATWGGGEESTAARVDSSAGDVDLPPAAQVEIVSDPPGQVYSAGREEALCRTPCEIAVSTRNSRSARRVYMIRRRGYHDETIAVDLSAPPRRVSVHLQRLRPAPKPPARPRLDRDGTLNPFEN
jgi:hypothetical protein